MLRDGKVFLPLCAKHNLLVRGSAGLCWELFSSSHFQPPQASPELPVEAIKEQQHILCRPKFNLSL